MKISVVTNAYNQGKFLAAAAQSVLSQEGVDVEYIIVDPGSNDNTPDVIAALQMQFPGRITLITEGDDGPADGLNKAFAKASGEWFIYLNADDVFLPRAFANAVKVMRKNPGAGAIIGNGYLVGENGQYIRRAISTRFTARRFVRGIAFALQQATFYNAKVFRQVGGFNINNRTSWDAEILIDMDRAGFTLANFNDYIAIFRMQSASITMSQRFATESAATHLAYFEREMGRMPTKRDYVFKKTLQMLQRIAHPFDSVMRMKDEISPNRYIFPEALPPDWAHKIAE